MKRSSIKKPRKRIPRKSKSPTKKAKDKAWKLMSEYIRLRDAIETTGTTTQARCCTCNKVYPAFGPGCIQAGHFLVGRKLSTLFDERNVAAQCFGCNIHRKGHAVEYFRYMQKKYGDEVIEELRAKDRVIERWMSHEYDALSEQLRAKIRSLRDTQNNSGGG